MSLFDIIIVQPIFNLLMSIIGFLPGSDFGIALILFTIIIRLLMWPLVKKQLHQTRVLREIQPEMKKIRVKAKGNKQLEGQLMLELYRERGVNPFGSIGLLLVQLPIFIALFQVIQIFTNSRERIAEFTYGFVEQLPAVSDIISQPDQYDESLLGLIDLTQQAVGGEGIVWSLVALAALAAVLQYVQSKQILPKDTEKKKLRDILKSSAEGKEVDQAEISQIMSQRLITFFPFLMFVIAIYLPGALVLYYAAGSAVAIIQQRILLGRDVEEMEEMAEKSAKKDARNKGKKKAATTNVRVKKAAEAEIVEAMADGTLDIDKKPRKKKKGTRRARNQEKS